MYFNNAVRTISEVGAHGDHELANADFSHDDRSKRIRSAAESLGDFVYEYLMDDGHIGDFVEKTSVQFKQEHLPIIARMIAVGMMQQFEHDEDSRSLSPEEYARHAPSSSYAPDE